MYQNEDLHDFSHQAPSLRKGLSTSCDFPSGPGWWKVISTKLKANELGHPVISFINDGDVVDDDDDDDDGDEDEDYDDDDDDYDDYDDDDDDDDDDMCTYIYIYHH